MPALCRMLQIWYYAQNYAGIIWQTLKSVDKYPFFRALIYKQQFLHFDWLRACQLIPNQCKKVKLSAKKVKFSAER